MTPPVFELQRISYRYNAEVNALHDISLTITSGERVAILGANGSGKSTLLRLLDGLYFPHQGTLNAFGEPLTEERLQDDTFAFAFRRRVALVFQNPDVQLFNPTVFDEVAFGPLQLRWPKAQVRQAVSDTLDLLEISHLKDRAPHRLSGGEKKRVALASVMVLDPAVLLMDEPTAALDPKSQSRVVDFLIGWGGGAKTVVVATHDLDVVSEIADRCYVFQNGRIVTEGTPLIVLHDEDMLQSSNLVHAHRHSHHNDGQHVHHDHHVDHVHHEAD